MSSSESDNSDTSYQSDDSDVNFIPEYVIEDAELNDGNREYSIGVVLITDKNRQKLDPELEDDGCSGIAYADEPLADEAWLETYHKEEQERLEVEEKLGKRLNGSVDTSEW